MRTLDEILQKLKDADHYDSPEQLSADLDEVRRRIEAGERTDDVQEAIRLMELGRQSAIARAERLGFKKLAIFSTIPRRMLTSSTGHQRYKRESLLLWVWQKIGTRQSSASTAKCSIWQPRQGNRTRWLLTGTIR